MKQFFFACLIVIVTTAESKAQCNLIRNGDFSQNTAQLWQPITNSNMSYWTVGGQAGASSDPDLYPNSSIYMYDNNNHNPVDEFIEQQLCTPITLPLSMSFTFKIDASYSAYNQGKLEVVLANSTSEYIIVNATLTSSMTTYTYQNALASVPSGTYDRIIIRPRANVTNNVMSIVVDNVSLTIDKQPYTSNTVTSTCCISPMNLDFTGTYYTEGFITQEWVNLKTSQVIGDQPSVSVTPGNGGGKYVFEQTWNYCGTPCVITSDTFIVKCCGGDDDWAFSDPNNTTINDAVYRMGNVGIGTNSPTEKLDIDGTMRLRSVANNNTANQFLVLDGGVVKYRDNVSTSSFAGWYKQPNTTITPTSINDDIYTNGRVKIGQQLEVSSTYSQWGGTLTGGTYDRFVIYADNTNGLLFEGPLDENSHISGDRLPIKFSWRGDATPAMMLDPIRRLGIGTTTPNDRLTVHGNITPNTDGVWRLGRSGYRWSEVWAVNSTIQTSDINEKNSINPLSYGLEEIMELRPVTYKWKENDNGTRIGFIAQELEETISEVIVKEDGKYGVRYTEIIPVLVKGIQEQQTIIEEQNTKIAELEQAIAEIKAAINGEGTQPQPKLEGRGSSNQMNLRPNPTNGKTNIDYVIKGTFQTAKVEVYNSVGQLLGKYSVNSEGIGNVEIDTTAWAGGTYFCKLIVDSSVQDTKKLVVSK